MKIRFYFKIFILFLLWSAILVASNLNAVKADVSSTNAFESLYAWSFVFNYADEGENCGTTAKGVCDEKGCGPGLACDTKGTYGKTCVCVKNNQVCKPGATNACKMIGVCEAISVCKDDGTWGECIKKDPKCQPYPTIEPANEAFYSWTVSSYSSGPYDPPYAIEDCKRNLDCRSGQSLPSPSPWYMPASNNEIPEGWSSERFEALSGNIINPLACINSQISVRFSQEIELASLVNNVVLLKQSGKEWQPVITSVISETDLFNDKKQLNLRTAELEPATNYKVVLKKNIRSTSFLTMRYNSEDHAKVIARNCNVGGIADAAYCWNFQTRKADDKNLRCQAGCPECTPDPTKMFWLGAMIDNHADAASNDNACLLVNPWSYSWLWTKSSPNNTKRIDITNNDAYSYSTVNGNINFGKDGKIDPVQKSTALGETIRDKQKTKIIATLNGKGDYCEVINDFTNPIVIENNDCRQGTTQSPSPAKGSQNACSNAVISARFSRNMNNKTIIGTNNTHPNIIVQECDSKEKSLLTNMSACTDVGTNWPIEIFQSSYDSMSISDMAKIDFNGSLPEGFFIEPQGQLKKNQWYRVIILGGDNGVRGSSATNGGETSHGILKTPTMNYDFDRSQKDNANGDGSQDYLWIFKTTDVCQIDTVNVSPGNMYLKQAGPSQLYRAFPQAQNCNILSGSGLTWNWKSLLKLSENIDVTNGGTGDDIASVCRSGVSKCESYNNPTSSVALVTSKKNGLVNIKATVLEQNKWGYGKLQIGEINSSCPIGQYLSLGHCCAEDKEWNGSSCAKPADDGPKPIFNPCSNGIWRIPFPANVVSSTITIEKCGGIGCSVAVQGGSFISKIFNKIKVAFTRLIGLSATAANWTQVVTENFSVEDFQNIQKGNLEKSSGNFSIVAYPDSGNKNIINYINNGNWDRGQYKVIINYSLNQVDAQTLDESMITRTSVGYMNVAETCKIKKTVINVWPKGENKQQDNFFCSGENCGKKTNDGKISSHSDEYDDDVSADWSISTTGYDLKDGGSYLSGNQHLYRAWATADKGYLLKANNYTWSMANSGNANTVNTAFSSTNFAGDQWITAGANGGLSQLKVVATDGSDSATGKININTFLCGNPWPNPQNFPFVDSNSNCTGGGNCINTTFQTYYCRDQGTEALEDDLPNIGFDDNTSNEFLFIKGKSDNALKEFLFRRTDSSPGAATYDRLGSNHGLATGTISMAIDGKIGEGVEMTGPAGKSAVLINSPYVISPAEGTISLWFSTDSAQSAKLVYIGGNDGGSMQNLSLALVGGKLNFNFTAGGAGYDLSATQNLADGNWHLITAVYRNNGYVQLYIDGKLTVSDNSAKNILASKWSAPTVIGALPDKTQNFIGKLDEVKFYNKSLTAEQIVAEFTNGETTATPVAHYPFNANDDVLAFRVISNPEHYSPSRWFQETFTKPKSPAKTTVDGYPAFVDGRTTYIGGTSVSGNNIYSDIYLLSYSEGADQSLMTIYQQLMNNLVLNNNLSNNFGQCSSNPDTGCLTDNDCRKVSAGYCLSDKAKLVRDATRLADLQDIKLMFAEYYEAKRCNKNREQLCANSSFCSASGANDTCGNYYPNLISGSYIAGKSFSIWPSWQATLGNIAGQALPVDPINKFSLCNDPYEASTCWSEKNKAFHCPTANSWVYYYNASDSLELFAHKEFNSGNWQGDSVDDYLKGNNFTDLFNGFCKN